MKSKKSFVIGMRKIKSLIAVSITFVIWQLVRIFLPQLEIHPLFAYIYALIEMRDTAEKTKKFGILRIKTTFIGLIVGLVFVSLSIQCSAWASATQQIFIDFVLILIASLISLCIAEKTGCENFCGIAAIISIICMVSHPGEDRYLYAIMRVVQTLLGVFAAAVVNSHIYRYPRKDKSVKDNPTDEKTEEKAVKKI